MWHRIRSIREAALAWVDVNSVKLLWLALPTPLCHGVTKGEDIHYANCSVHVYDTESSIIYNYGCYQPCDEEECGFWGCLNSTFIRCSTKSIQVAFLQWVCALSAAFSTPLSSASLYSLALFFFTALTFSLHIHILSPRQLDNGTSRADLLPVQRQFYFFVLVPLIHKGPPKSGGKPSTIHSQHKTPSGLSEGNLQQK